MAKTESNEQSGRTIAIGDIHGCAAALQSLVALVDPVRDDTIVTLGDYVDRGPDSRAVIDLLINLDQRCRLVPILGNHDEMLLELQGTHEPPAWFLAMGGAATLDSYGPGRTLDLVSEAHFAFLERCRDYHETPQHIFLHANYEPDVSMDQQPVPVLRWESLRDSTPGRHYSGKTVITGHTSQKGGEILDLGYLKCIDTYCYGGGWLTALDVHTGQVWQVNRHGRRREGNAGRSRRKV